MFLVLPEYLTLPLLKLFLDENKFLGSTDCCSSKRHVDCVCQRSQLLKGTRLLRQRSASSVQRGGRVARVGGNGDRISLVSSALPWILLKKLFRPQVGCTATMWRHLKSDVQPKAVCIRLLDQILC